MLRLLTHITFTNVTDEQNDVHVYTCSCYTGRSFMSNDISQRLCKIPVNTYTVLAAGFPAADVVTASCRQISRE